MTECSLELEELTPGVTPAPDYDKQWGQGNSCKGRWEISVEAAGHRVPGTVHVAQMQPTGWSQLPVGPTFLALKVQLLIPPAASRLLTSLSYLFLPWSGQLHAQGRVLNPD